ncbi:MAG: RecQ family ATP-dependent DNA helicase [Planctomycetota bacterium]
MVGRARELLSSIAFLDLEVGLDGRLRDAGVVFGDREIRIDCGDEGSAIDALADAVGRAQFLGGHNLLWHDLPRLAALRPHAPILRMPVLDTLLLSPLAFPRRPYHRLVKDYKLQRESANDPVADARLSRDLLQDEIAALANCERGLLDVIATCIAPQIGGIVAASAAAQLRVAEAASTYGGSAEDDERPSIARRAADGGGHARLLESLGAQPCATAALQAWFEALEGCCVRARRGLVERHRARRGDPLELAFVANWLVEAASADSVGSVLPAWVRRGFPGVRDLLTELRDSDCGEAGCAYCRQMHDADALLRRHFGFEFRERPATADGRSLQRAIVECGLHRGSLLGILPTGGGKSVCFQLPALVRHERKGALTVVFSPLQALMQDQVDQLKTLVGGAVAMINGLLTPPDRGDAMERVRLGEVAILYISPEQLRSPSCARLLDGREIAAWVFDEAHCLAKWGHDFRPDYLYASRFIREQAERLGVPQAPIVCLTATARTAVRDEIREHFRKELGIELTLFEGGVRRDNLEFAVEVVPHAHKQERIRELVEEQLQAALTGAVIVYCARRRHADELAEHLTQRGLEALSYHAGLDAGLRKARQDAFVHSEARVMCATNAFGMGVNKSDVRLIVHAQMPASLENYLQEAGRAGRDGLPARCVLLHDNDDVEAQFELIASSRLSKSDLEAIWRVLKRKGKDQERPIVITTGELLRDDRASTSFDAEDRQASTKVVTAISWLERAGFLHRDENRTRAISVRLRERDRAKAHAVIAAQKLEAPEAELWRAVWSSLVQRRFDERCDTDALAELPEFRRWEEVAPSRTALTASQKALRVIHAMAKAGLVGTSTTMTAFLRDRVADPSRKRLENAAALERELLDLLPELAPDAEDTDPKTGQRRWLQMSLRAVNQTLRDRDVTTELRMVKRLLAGLGRDGEGLAATTGSLELRRLDAAETWQIRLRRDWAQIREIADRRREVAGVALDVMERRIDRATQQRSANQLVEFTYEDIEKALAADLLLGQRVKDRLAAIERALLWLHELEVVVLQGGLTVFRRAMTIGLRERGSGTVTRNDYGPLEEHYASQQEGVHVVARYAEVGAGSMRSAHDMVGDYFALAAPEFRRRHFAGESDLLRQGTTAESLRRIVEELRNPAQQAIVTADIDRNLLVLAGPGSGKTKVVVHRCAWLLRVQRVAPRSILLLCFNRSTAHELRHRLVALIGDAARSVTIATYHGFAARLCGRSFADRGARSAVSDNELKELLEEAVRTLELGADELDKEARRDELLAGYRYVLVDEYQDIDDVQYRLIAALAKGGTGKGVERQQQLRLMAVGDDDQSIYGFRHASVEFIRRFEEDYDAERHALTDNYRSSAAIVAVSNAVIAANRDRMKAEPIRAVRAPRSEDPAVEVLEIADGPSLDAAEALAVVEHVKGILGSLRCAAPRELAVLVRTHDTLHAIRTALEQSHIPVRVGIRASFPRARVAEVAAWLELLESREASAGALDEIALCAIRDTVVARHPDSPWSELLDGIVADCIDELVGDGAVSARVVRDYVQEALAEERRESAIGRGVELRTIHSAKGLEFDHVVVTDPRSRPGQTARQLEEERRLLYVAMTRAKHSLALIVRPDAPQPHLGGLAAPLVRRRTFAVPLHVQRVPSLGLRYEVLDLSAIWLDHAALRPADAAIHRDLDALRPGAVLRMADGPSRIGLVDSSGVRVGELSAAGTECWRPRLGRVREVRVVAVLRRERDDVRPRPDATGGSEATCRVDRWSHPLIEVVWETG